jgi:flagellar biosynthetic protein FlhB
MAAENGADRTEQPTSKKRSDARKKGQVAQSREVPSALILATALGMFYLGGGAMYQRLTLLVQGSLTRIGSGLIHDPASFTHYLMWIFQQTLFVLMPFMLAMLVAGVAANVAQVGFMVREDFLTPNFTKLNPVTGVKRLISLKALIELVKGVLKLLVVGGIAYLMLRDEVGRIPALVGADAHEILRYVSGVSFELIFFVCLALAVLALLDVGFQRWQHEQELMMTKQEVKDEAKQAEGDPKIKARIRRLQMEMAQRRMMAMVPSADVVITNPTHLALALKFDADTMAAPQVVAKGADLIAARIREVALEHGVPLVENKPLARTLFKLTDVGDTIPVELYRAVAEVLAYVYRLRGRR